MRWPVRSGAPRRRTLVGVAVVVLGAFGAVAWANAAPVSQTESLVQQIPKLTNPEGGAGRFGSSVALSGDGSTGLVGAPDADGGGAAFILSRTAEGGWSEGPQLAPEAEGGSGEACDPASEEEDGECRFGRSVALSANGQIAVVGSPRAPGACVAGDSTHPCAMYGEAQVFARSGSTWTLQATLVGGPEEASEGHFGYSVALSGDGSTAVVGAPRDRGGRGAVWVFRRSGSSWAQDGAKLAGGEELGEGHFGASVALADDGATVLIGGPGNAGYAGAAWVFSRSVAGWSQEGGRLDGGVEESGAGHFGSHVALSGDGSTAIVGAHRDTGGNGAAWVFVRAGAAWAQQGSKLTAPIDEGAPAEFGAALALSGDGSTALIGAPQTGGFVGRAWLFRRAEGAWSAPPQALELDEESGKGAVGASVALSADGSAALVGAPRDMSKAGAVWAVVRGVPPAPEVSALSPPSGPERGGTTVRITGAHLGNATEVDFAAAPATFKVDSPTSITVTSPPGIGTTDVIVRSPAGVSTAGPADRFTYVSATAQLPPSGSPPGTALSNTGEIAVQGYGPVIGRAGGRCAVRLLSSRLPVHAHARVMVRLRGTGTGRCRGRLGLTVRIRSRHARTTARSLVLGAGVFSFQAGATTTARLALDRAGRSLLAADHGRLRASLSLTTPSGAGRAPVRLTTPGPTGKVKLSRRR